MSDYTRGDDTVYNGFREGWECPCDAKEETEELWAIVEGIPLDRLNEICKAEREGRCVVLPCKAGDAVYRIISYKCNAVCNKLNACNSFIYKGCKQAEFYVCSGTFQLNDMWWIGKTVFLTREEAEAALKEQSDETHN